MTPRLRIRFAKRGKIRFTSHRDVARIWERSLRRARLPLAYSEGFSPRPKLSFGLALSTGYESLGEYLDVALRDDGDSVAPDEVPARVGPGLPEGIEVQAVVPLPPGAESLQQAVTTCTWHLDISGVPPAAAAEALTRALAARELPITRERKGRSVTDDVRPAILDARTLGPVDGPQGPATRMAVELATQPRALRPDELLTAVAPPGPDGPAWRPVRVTRIHQWTLVGGARQEVIPLPPAATPAPHAEARAS